MISKAASLAPCHRSFSGGTSFSGTRAASKELPGTLNRRNRLSYLHCLNGKIPVKTFSNCIAALKTSIDKAMPSKCPKDA